MCVIVACLVISSVAQPPPAATKKPATRSSVTVQDVRLKSAALNRETTYRVLLPPGYAHGSKRYPLLILLHGLSGDYKDWDERTRLADYAQHHQFVIVMPDGVNGWWINAANQQDSRYEDFLQKELLPDVEKRYRVIRARYGRAIAGLSMGGYGAIRLALVSPQTFAVAGSFSGAFSVTTDPALRSSWKELGLERIFDLHGSEFSRKNDVLELAKAANARVLPMLYLDCGTADRFLGPNRDLAAILREKKAVYEFREVPGDHGWVYWDRQISEFLRVTESVMRRAK